MLLKCKLIILYPKLFWFFSSYSIIFSICFSIACIWCASLAFSSASFAFFSSIFWASSSIRFSKILSNYWHQKYIVTHLWCLICALNIITNLEFTYGCDPKGIVEPVLVDVVYDLFIGQMFSTAKGEWKFDLKFGSWILTTTLILRDLPPPSVVWTNLIQNLDLCNKKGTSLKFKNIYI